MVQSSASSLVTPKRFRIAWLGDESGIELGLARRWVGELAEVVRPAARDDGMEPQAGPTAVILAGRRPGCWDLQGAAAIVRRWPLAPLIALGTSLDDGRRRSGPPLPGVEDMTWTDLPGRLAWWFAELAAGRPGSLGLPATVRREERLIEAAARIHAVTGMAGSRPRMAVAAGRRVDLEGLADLVAALGRPASTRTCGRPSLDVAADIVIWDVGPTSADDLTWLAMFTAHRPGLPVIVVESFPRGDTVLAALRAGATAVLGRPLSLEALAGTLLRQEGGCVPAVAAAAAETAAGTGIGAGGRDG